MNRSALVTTLCVLLSGGDVIHAKTDTYCYKVLRYEWKAVIVEELRRNTVNFATDRSGNMQGTVVELVFVFITALGFSVAIRHHVYKVVASFRLR